MARSRTLGPLVGSGMVTDTRERLEAVLRERIAVLDGSWGVLIQSRLAYDWSSPESEGWQVFALRVAQS